ncbi:MAG: hypothetical protein ACK566_07725, partial [Bacteroidota bacterium]
HNITLDGIGGTLHLGTTAITHTIRNNITVTNGTLVGGAASITLTGTSASPSIAGFTTPGSLSMTKTAGTATFTGNISAANLTLNGAGGTLHLGTGLTHTFSGIVARTNGTLNFGSSTVSLSNATPFSNTVATLVVGSSTINYSGAAQPVLDLTYNNLILSGSGVKTTSASVVVNGRLTLEGTASLSAAITYGGEASLRYNRTTPVTTSDFEFPSLFQSSGGVIIGGTGLITLYCDKVITEPLIIETGAQLSLSTFTGSSSKGLTLGGTPQTPGTYGGNTSAAGTINSTFFADATGILNVTAPDATWLGITSDWSDPANWSIGSVPDLTTNALINSGT